MSAAAGISAFQIERDRPGIRNDVAVVADHRHLVLPAEGDRRLVAHVDGMDLERQVPCACSASRVRQEKVLKRQSSRPPSSHNSIMPSLDILSILPCTFHQSNYTGACTLQERRSHARRQATRNVAKLATAARDPASPPLGRTERESAFLEFEQALICASEAFYRFAGAALGPSRRVSTI